jgi:uncharacterized protein (TIGR02145 family)
MKIRTNLPVNYLLISGIYFLITLSCSKEAGPVKDIDKIVIEYGEVNDIAGNTYKTVIIGRHEWMAENLRTVNYNDGSEIYYPGSDISGWVNSTGGAYALYDNQEPNLEMYGALYNWHAINSSAGICPTGWRVPGHDDWWHLRNYMISNYGLTNSDIAHQGVANKLKSCRQAGSPMGSACDTEVHPRWNFNYTHYGTDNFGFSALPSGSRRATGEFSPGTGSTGRWWSSTSSNAEEAWTMYITFNSASMARGAFDKRNGYAVRCLRDID